MRKIILILCSLFILTSCGISISEKETLKDKELREKIGMMFIVRPDALDLSIPIEDVINSKTDGVKTVNENMLETYEKYPCGGFAIFKKNITNEEQLISLNESLHNLSDHIVICIDEEGGLVARLANHDAFDVEKFENMEDIANSEDYDRAYELGITIGTYLEKYGIDVDFAPVADVNTNPDNTVIGVRAFGDDPTIAKEMVVNVIKGLHDADIKSCIKHFPGHGDTGTDTHYGYAETMKTWDEIKELEMITFIEGIKEGTDLVMCAHISLPNVTGNNEPATLSYEIITNKLRNELGFDGVIITDAMEMGAISKEYSSAEAAIKAIEAGIDIILMPANYIEAFDAVYNAVKEGRIPESRIDESYNRILNLSK